MKKTYAIPQLVALSLTTNEAFCGACEGNATLYNNEFLRDLLADFLGLSGTERSNFDPVFGTDESCEIPMDGYCKFTSNDSGEMVLWS